MILLQKLFHICLFAGLCLGTPAFASSSDTIVKAEEAYRKGEAAPTSQERSEAFNQALSLYSSLEEGSTSGYLCYNIANCYFQLSEYPLAIFYYRQALKYRPLNVEVGHNLDVALGQQGLPIQEEGPTWTKWVFLGNEMAGIRQFRLLEFLSIFCFLSWGLYLWVGAYLFRLGMVISALFGTAIFLSLFWLQFLSPVEAVLLNPSPLYKDAGAHYSKVLPKALKGGSLLEVLGASDDGQWIQVSTEDGKIGYIQGNSLRVLKPFQAFTSNLASN